MDDFEFKPISDGLGFHRKPTSASTDGDDDAFSFSSLGAPLGNSTSSAVNGSGLTPNSGAADPDTAFSSKAKVRHNSKGVSDLIAALPPALDFLDERDRQSLGVAKATSTAATVSTSVASTMTSTMKQTFLKMPIGREDYKHATGQSAPQTSGVSVSVAAAASTSSVDESLAKLGKSFPHMGRLAGQPAAQALRDGSLSQEKARTNEAVIEKGVAFHFGAAILDTLVVLGVGCVLLAVLLGVTGANLVALLENSKTDTSTMTLLGVLFVASGLLYTLAARSFMGSTLGEWSYEIRIGSAARRSRWFYPFLVLWRSAIVAATGFIFFPVVSALVGHDVLKWLTGLEIVAIEPEQ